MGRWRGPILGFFEDTLVIWTVLLGFRRILREILDDFGWMNPIRILPDGRGSTEPS